MPPALETAAKPPVPEISLEAGASSNAYGALFTATNLRAWGKKSALSLIDQGFTSGASFGVNIFLARLMPAEEYGAFAVAFAAFLFFSGFHNVLLLEPMSVLGPARYADALPEYFRKQLQVHTVLVGALSAAVFVFGLVLWRITPSSPLVGAVIGGALALPFLLLLWLVRRMCYVVQRPATAALGSAFYLVFVVGGLFLLWRLRLLGSFTAFSLMAAGSLFAAGVLAWRLGLFAPGSDAHGATSWRLALRENWGYGRWLVGSIVLFSVSSQTQMFLVAGSLGLGAAGVLRAMQIPSLAMAQVVTAIGLLVLPTLSYEFGRGATERIRHKAMLVSAGLFVVTAGFAALLALEARRTGQLLFGGKYEAYVWLMPLLALIPAVNGISAGYSMALRASQKPRFDLISNLFAAPVAVVSAFVFMRIWGLAGAAMSMLLSYAVLSFVTIVFFRKHEREEKIPADGASVLE